MATWRNELRKVIAGEMSTLASYEMQSQVRYRVNLLLKDAPASKMVCWAIEEAFRRAGVPDAKYGFPLGGADGGPAEPKGEEKPAAPAPAPARSGTVALVPCPKCGIEKHPRNLADHLANVHGVRA